MAFLGDIIKINEADYTALKNAGSAGYVINGVRYYYNENNIYLTVEDPDKGEPDYSSATTINQTTSGLPSGYKPVCKYYQAPANGILWPSISNDDYQGNPNLPRSFHIYSAKTQSWSEYQSVYNGYGTTGGLQIRVSRGDYVGIAYASGSDWGTCGVRAVYFIPII